jgi:hypothetical protein
VRYACTSILDRLMQAGWRSTRPERSTGHRIDRLRKSWCKVPSETVAAFGNALAALIVVSGGRIYRPPKRAQTLILMRLSGTTGRWAFLLIAARRALIVVTALRIVLIAVWHIAIF